MKTALMAVILATFILFGGTFQAEAEHTSWIELASDLQENIDLDAPFSQALWIGTHNSFNADDDGYPDPNQSLSVANQMVAGVREIVFDVHAIDNGLFICHGGDIEVVDEFGVAIVLHSFGCSKDDDRRLGEGLQDIRDYLVPNNRDDVILLKMELHLHGRHSAFTNKLNDILGPDGADIIYNPPLQGGQCQYLDQSTLTKQMVLDAGKNVVIVVNGCNSNTKFSNTVFGGVQHPEGLVTGGGGHKFVSFESRSDCNDAVGFVEDKGWVTPPRRRLIH